LGVVKKAEELPSFRWAQGTVKVAKSMIRELVEKAAAIKVQCCSIAPIHSGHFPHEKKLEHAGTRQKDGVLLLLVE